MVARRRADERESTYRWVNRLQMYQGRYDNLRAAMEAHVHHAQNLQPITGAIPVILEELLGGLKKTVDAVDSWYGTARIAQRRDIERVDDPSGGSADRERRGDAGYTMRDM
jgi:hypothetical protein